MDFRSIMMGVSFSCIWSSAFTLAKLIVTAASPLKVLSLLFLISGLLGIALARILVQKIKLNKGGVDSSGGHCNFTKCSISGI